MFRLLTPFRRLLIFRLLLFMRFLILWLLLGRRQNQPPTCCTIKMIISVFITVSIWWSANPFLCSNKFFKITTSDFPRYIVGATISVNLI